VKKSRLVLVGTVIVGSLGWVAAQGLTENLVYYSTPTELLERGPEAVGQRTRLGGYVVPGSMSEDGERVTFVVSDGSNRLTVIGTGSVPALFREGQGVVVEGAYGEDGAFHADTMLVRHGSDYRPPDPGETPTSVDLEEGG
jgi:cytochrome c-type biogenesis protein CcmE